MKKHKYKYLVVLLPLLGLRFGRFIVSEYGEESRIIMISILLLMLLITIIVLVLKKKSYDAIMSICVTIPALIAGMGVYLDNSLLIITGIVLEFVVIIIFLVIKKYREK
jgi:hypothetical protein